MKVLFLGSSHFSKVVLEKMIALGQDITAIITQPDKPSGRGHKLTPTEVKVFAQGKNIPCYTFDKIKNHIDEIKEIDFDISVVASFGQILPQGFLDIKPCINVHPSLLPKYRGASPIQNAILNGDEKTGVTIMKVAMAVDSGDILAQEEVEIGDEYYSELEEKLAIKGGEMVSEVVLQYKRGTVVAREQEHDKATFVSKFEKQDGYLDFAKTAKEIVCRVRALGEEIGCFIIINGQPLKIERVDKIDFEELAPKQIANNRKRFIIGCKDGAIEVLMCKAPSGKSIRGQDYLNGHNEILGKRID